MGHIARRRKKKPHPLRGLFQRFLRVRRMHKEDDAMPEASSTARLWFNKLWHLTDSARWMDPLPLFHRRGIVVAAIVVLLAFLWPSPTPQQPQRPITYHSGETDVPIQAELSGQQPDNNEQQQSAATADSQGQWHDYQIAAGQTLAQLFRDRNLPVNDVFAMARVEGTNKPLSNLQTGQRVRIRQNAQGVVTGLTVEVDGGQVLFTRQPDGSFLQAQ